MNAAEAPWQQRIRKSRRVESAGSQQPDAASSLPDSDWRPLDILVETETNIRAMGGQGRDPSAIRSLLPQTTWGLAAPVVRWSNAPCVFGFCKKPGRALLDWTAEDSCPTWFVVKHSCFC